MTAIPAVPTAHRPRRRRARRWIAAGVPVMALCSLFVAPAPYAAAASATPARTASDARSPGGYPGETKATDGLISGDMKCEQPSSSVTASRQRSLGTGGAVETVSTEILKLLGEGAVHWGEDKGLGWLLSLATGQQESNGVDPAIIDQQFDQVNKKLDALAQQQYHDCNTILAALDAAKLNNDKDQYDGLAQGMATQIGNLVTYQQDYDDIVTALQQNGGSIDRLNSVYKDDMRSMLAGGTDGLRSIINRIDAYEQVAQPGAESMINLFSRILTQELGQNPYHDHIFTSEFADTGYAQESYYAALVSQAAYLYSNVAHLNFSIGDYQHTDDPSAVVSLVNVAQKDIQQWDGAFSDGAPGDGKPGWVSQGKSQGIGSIPSDTVLDYRVQSHPMLWTQHPVSIDGQPDSPAPYYCGTTAQYCYADVFDADGKIAGSRLVTPSAEPMATLVTASDHDELRGWRVPSITDWDNLTAGATGGLPTWAASMQLDQFRTEEVTSLYDGHSQLLTVIPPVLAAAGTVANPAYFSVLSAAQAIPEPGKSLTADQLTVEHPGFTATPSGQADVAGRLFLTMDFTPTSPAAPVKLSVSTASASTAAGLNTVKPATRRQASAAEPPPASRYFGTPTSCTSPDTYTVPAGVGSLTIKAAGGSGADGFGPDSAPGHGGHGGTGGTVTETIPATAGQTLYVQVGGAAFHRGGGIAGGGDGGVSATSEDNGIAGGGGGASGVATDSRCAQWLIVAGGGGGGGAGFADNTVFSTHAYTGGSGGDGCAGTTLTCTGASKGQAAISGLEGKAGGAEPANFGGLYGGAPNGTAGTAGQTMKGGDGGGQLAGWSTDGGGGGGAGYYGGGGGGGGGAAGGGGGGGASFAIRGATDVSYGLAIAGNAGWVSVTPHLKPQMPASLSVSASTVEWNQSLTLTGHFPADATGTVGFYDNDKGGLGTAPIRDGTATLSIDASALGLGSHRLHVSTGEDTHYLANDSSEVSVSVVKVAATPIHLTINGTRMPAGQQPTSMVTQVPPDATGTINYLACQATNGCIRWTAPIVDGYASLDKFEPKFNDGTYTVYANYPGDEHYQGGSSPGVQVTIGHGSA